MEKKLNIIIGENDLKEEKDQRELLKTFENRQLTEYRTLSDGRSGCLFYTGIDTFIQSNGEPYCVPQLFFLESEVRRYDKYPYIDELHEYEKQILGKAKPLLEGYDAWIAQLIARHGPDKYGNLVIPPTEHFDGGMKACDITIIRDVPKMQNSVHEQEWQNIVKEFWGNAIVEAIIACSDYYANERLRVACYNREILDENDNFDYAKALLTADVKPLPYCPITLNDGTKIQYSNKSAFRAWQIGDHYCFDPEKSYIYSLNADFGAALINLARNVCVYQFSINQKQFWEPYELITIYPQDLDFDFDTDVKVIYRTYYNRLKNLLSAGIRKLPESVGVNDQDLDRCIYLDLIKGEHAPALDPYIGPHLSEQQIERIKNYFMGFVRFVTNDVIGIETANMLLEKLQELPQPEPEQHKEDICCYINREQILKNGIYTLQQFENLLQQAAENDAPSLVKFLKKYLSTGDLDFHGDSRTKIHRNLQEHFPSMRKYSDRNFTEACNKGDFSPFPLKKAEK